MSSKAYYETHMEHATKASLDYYYDHIKGKYRCKKCGVKSPLKLVMCEHRDRLWLCARCEITIRSRMIRAKPGIRAFAGRKTPQPRVG